MATIADYYEYAKLAAGAYVTLDGLNVVDGAVVAAEAAQQQVNGVRVDLFRWPRILPMYPESMKAS